MARASGFSVPGKPTETLSQDAPKRSQPLASTSPILQPSQQLVSNQVSETVQDPSNLAEHGEWPETTESSSDLEGDGQPLDASKVLADLPISPSEDIKSYGELIKKVAKALGLPISEPKTHDEDVIN